MAGSAEGIAENTRCLTRMPIHLLIRGVVVCVFLL